MYTLHTSAPFTAFMTIREENGITYVTLTATAAGEAAPLDISLEWKTPDIGVHLSWSPLAGTYKRVRPRIRSRCRAASHVFDMVQLPPEH